MIITLQILYFANIFTFGALFGLSLYAKKYTRSGVIFLGFIVFLYVWNTTLTIQPKGTVKRLPVPEMTTELDTREMVDRTKKMEYDYHKKVRKFILDEEAE